MVGDQLADEHRVFANTTGKDDAVQSVQGGGMPGDVARDTVDKDLNRQPGARMAVVPGFFQRAQVRREAGNPEQTGLFIYDALKILERLPGLLGNPRHRAKIDIATARAHHQPFQRGHAH